MIAEITKFHPADYTAIQYARKLREGAKVRFAEEEAKEFEPWFTETYPHLHLKSEYDTETKKTTYSLDTNN